MAKKVIISAPQYYGIDEDIREAFEAIGFEAILNNSRTKLTNLERIAKRLIQRFPILGSYFNYLFKFYLIKENEEFIAYIEKEKPDFLFVVNGEQFFPDTLQQLKTEMSIPMAVYYWDDPFHADASILRDNYRKSNSEKGMLFYDYIFVFDTYYIEEIKKKGACNVEYLPLATNPDRYKEIKMSNEDIKNYNYDICFVGSASKNREAIFEMLKSYKLGVFGDDWVKYFLFQGKRIPSYYKGSAVGEKVIKIYLSSKIALNIHHHQSKEGLNTRSFDIPACGAFQLVDYKKNLEKHFRIGQEIITFKTNEELIELINHYLRNPEVVKSVLKKGQQRVLNEHTWINRMQHVIDTLRSNGILKNGT